MPRAASNVVTLEALDAEQAALEGELRTAEAEVAALEREEAKRLAEERMARMETLRHALQAEIDKRKSQRTGVEQRWLRCLRQYNNQYEPQFQAELDSRQYGSRAFVPLTRRICNIIEARLGDLLFPTDERGYSISASPNPELSEAQADADRLPPGHQVQAGGQTVLARNVSLAIRELREEAAKRAAAMQRTVDDRMKEADWPSIGRAVIHQGVVLGSGVAKGPYVRSRKRKRWLNVMPGVPALVVEEDYAPTAAAVDVWDFFPDMSARSIEHSESEYERHRLNKAQFAKLAREPGFDPDAIRYVLENEPPALRDANEDAKREPSGTSGVEDKRWWVWERHGPIDLDDLQACGCEIPDEILDDPLVTYEGIVWFADNGPILKAAITPMDTDERPYSVFNWQRDSSSIFGFGLPYELRDLQDAANSTFRATQDNGGLSVGPQIVINRKKLAPMNGRWEIEPRKLWEPTDRGESVDPRMLFTAIEIPSHIADLLNLFMAIKQLIDEIGGPMLAMQGQDSPSLMKTDLGKSIAYSAANVWMKRGVKNFDDQITAPVIGRFVSWELQYNPDPQIKSGDLHTIARGTSALIEAEGQIQRTLQLLEAAKELPLPIKRKIAMLRAMAKAMRLEADDVLPDDDEVRQLEEDEKRLRENPPIDPERARIQIRQVELEDRKAEREHILKIEDMRTRIRLAEIASREGLTIEQARLRYGIEEVKVASELQDHQEQRAHDAQKFNAELVTKQRLGSGI